MNGIASTFNLRGGWCFPHIKLKGGSPKIFKTTAHAVKKVSDS